MDIGVRELKQNLSKYLKRAAAGEIIRVTERGAPLAVIAPIPGRVRVQEGISEGWITAAEPPKGTRSRSAKIHRASSKRRSADVLSEDRGR